MTSLKMILKMNATSCVLFGCVMLIAPHAVSDFLGDAPLWALQTIGGILIINGVHLSIASQRPSPISMEILWFSLGDMSWWLLTLGLIATGYWITTLGGIIVAMGVAIGVATLGLLQLWCLGLQRTGHTSKEHFVRICVSWMSLPGWVKAWLIVLNGVFLWSVFYWPSDLTKITLTAFVATGPLLMGQLAFDGGLRRILSLAHLVSWVPFLGWLLWQFHTEHSGYAQTLAVTLSICLAFDVYDLVQFWRGDREIIGRKTAVYPRK